MTRTSVRRPRAPSIASLAAELDRQLREAGDPDRAVKEKAYLKSPIEHYGATVPAIRRVVKEFLRGQEGLTHRTLVDVVRRLWAAPIHEQRMAAVELLEQRVDDLEPGDLDLVEELIRDSFTWAYVDGLAASVGGALVERFPRLADELDRWAVDESFWLRRAALLALLGPVRKGAGDWGRFVRYADMMLDEREFFVRKAIGWVLREASKKRPERVRDYVARRLDRMSGVTFREAVKRLPEAERRGLQEARAAM
jgi:3-methyladenine DNA glycosylase AlkD